MKKLSYFLLAVVLTVGYGSLFADWNGSGTFSRIHDWTDDRDAGINISASRMDAEDDSFATGINACLAKNGENAATGTINLDGNKLDLDDDQDTSLGATADDRIDFELGGTTSVRFGHDSTNTGAVYLFDGPAYTSQANTDVARVKIAASNAIDIPAGTTAIGAGLHIAEPNFTETGTLTSSASLYVADDPSEATNNYSLWVDAGVVRLDGTTILGNSTAGDGQVHVFTATAGSVTAGASQDDLVVENSTDGGVVILTPDANFSQYALGSPTAALGAQVRWKYDDLELGLNTRVTNGFITFATDNDTEAVRIDASQRVGIGTTSPAQKLHINSGGTNVALRLQSTDADSSIEMIDDTTTVTGNSPLVLVRTGDATRFFSGGSEAFRISSAQDVGIGSTSPSARLHVADGAATLSVLELDGAGTTVGPTLQLVKDQSGAVANNDVAGALSFEGDNAVNTKTTYAQLRGISLAVTGGNEEGELWVITNSQTIGNTAARLKIGQGVYTPSATGGDQGAGTINAEAVYDDGTGPLTDYVLDAHIDGDIDLDYYHQTAFGGHLAEAWDQKELDIQYYVNKWRGRRALPPFMDRVQREHGQRMGNGQMIQALLETVEVQAVHIAKLHERLSKLEHKGRYAHIECDGSRFVFGPGAYHSAQAAE